jgi:hypothetical protein
MDSKNSWMMTNLVFLVFPIPTIMTIMMFASTFIEAFMFSVLVAVGWIFVYVFVGRPYLKLLDAWGEKKKAK